MNELGLLAEQVGASERTLRRAVNEGTLRGTRLSARRLRLSSAEKDYVLRRWGLLAQLRLALRTEPNVRFAVLFGSAARGEDREGSDVDLLVEMIDPSLVRIADLELKLEGLLGKRVDVVAMEDAQSNPQLLAEAAREGRVIVDRDERWPKFSAEIGHFEERVNAEYPAQKQRALIGIAQLSAQA
ncbi:MAG TPA: nucleotidyltransferase domain-containing protein [Solirubrobacterales bacterium]